MNRLLFIFLISFLPLAGNAQLSVRMKVERMTFLENEPVTAVVTITNRSGSELLLHSETQGRLTKSWLDFDLRKSGGKPLNRLNHGAFRAAKLPAGQSISRRVNLSQLYGLNRQGNFSTNAKITVAGTTYRSNSTHFNVSAGRTIFKQTFGAPETKYPQREYRVITFNDGKKTSLYTAVHDAKTTLSLSTNRISNALTFHRPQSTLDGKNNLHVLYLSTPEIFVHASIDKDGRILASQFYQRGASGNPSLMPFLDGTVKVRGGILYDPKKDAQERAKARTISERKK